MEVLERELKALEKDKDAFIEDFSEVRFSSNFFFNVFFVDAVFRFCINSRLPLFSPPFA